MSTQLTAEELDAVLQAAWNAHHEFEMNALKGEHDKQWPGWYAAFVIGRLGDFTTPTKLASFLSEAPASENWTSSAANYILEQLGKS